MDGGTVSTSAQLSRSKRLLEEASDHVVEAGIAVALFSNQQQQTGWDSSTLSSDSNQQTLPPLPDSNRFQLPSMAGRRKRLRTSNHQPKPDSSFGSWDVVGSSSGAQEKLIATQTSHFDLPNRLHREMSDGAASLPSVSSESGLACLGVPTGDQTTEVTEHGKWNQTSSNSSLTKSQLVRFTNGTATGNRRLPGRFVRGLSGISATAGPNSFYGSTSQLSPIDQLCMAVCRSDHAFVSVFLQTYPKSHHAKTKPLAELLKSKGSIGATVVYIAAKYRNVWALKEFIARGADVNLANLSGVTPLYIAGHYGCLQAVQALCEAGADVERAKTDGATVTYSACKHGHLEVVKMLVKHGAKTERSRKKNGMSLLHVAAQHGHTELVKYLITELKADTNQPTITGGTALHLACFQRRVDTVKLLIQCGADVDIRDRAGGWTALHIATQQGNVEIVDAVLRAPVCPGSNSLQLIPMEALQGRTVEGPIPPGFKSRAEYTRVVLSRLWRTKDDGYSLLMVSCRTGRSLGLTEYLIQMGASCSQKLNDGSTPFLIAAKHGRLSHVQYFIQRELQRRKQLKICETQPQASATNGEQLNIVEQVSQHGWTALHWAARGGFVDMVKALIKDNLIPVDTAVISGMTALYIASHHGHLNVVKTLVEAGADINLSMVNGASPLYTACKHGMLRVAEYLLKMGANLEVTNSRGSSPLHTACNHNHPEVVKFLVREAGADPSSTKGQEGWMAIHIACRVGALEIVKFLVEEAGVDITTKTEDYGGVMGGFAALHLAASHGRMSIVRYLVGKAGAQVDIPSSTRITPSQLALRRNRHDVKTWLDRAGSWTPLMFAADARELDEVYRLLRTDNLVRHVDERSEQGDTALALALAGPDSDQAADEEADDASAGVNQATPWLPVDRTIVDVLQRAALPYYPGNHNLYPKCVRDTAMTILGVSIRLHIIPKELWLVIMSYLGRNFLDE